ncbi:MAG: alpha-L-rhamnosidase [Calditrichaeota bacterium]|nr:alpha-L-rhamnosidase [Calditrichota bacterium]
MRMKGLIVVSVILVSIIAQKIHARQTTAAPTGLLCELLRDPSAAVITERMPVFGWIVNDSLRGAMQTAFQIIVSSSKELVDRNKGDMWNSDKVQSDRSINVKYHGKPLQPNASYWWKVRTWDASDVTSPFSKVQHFRTGNFDDNDRAWPAESKWVRLENGEWVLENRQKASYQDIEPKRIVRLEQGHYFVDFGKSAFATLRFNVTTDKEGDSVVVYLGERCNDDNTVHKNSGVSNIGFKRVVVNLQRGNHTYTIQLPRKISHYPNSQVLAEHMPEVLPFRYAEIIAAPSAITQENIRQIALFYYFDDDASDFTSSSEKLNQVWDLCKYTLKATPFLSLYADGNRERMPYEADAYIQQLGHYCVDREFSVARYTLKFLIFNPSWPTEWQMHTVFIAYADYMHTGNTEVIEQFYKDLRAKTLIALEREDGLISTRTGLLTKEFYDSIHYRGKSFRDIVDWPPGTPVGQKQATNHGPTPEGERDGYVFMPINTVVNAFHYRDLVLMAEMADAIGKTDDAEFLRTRAEKVKESFNRLLFDRQRGIYVDGIGTDHASLHANMFPLAFGLVPQEDVAGVVKFIKSRGMACSVYGAQYLLEALYRVGEAQYALDLMTSESKRSWLNMIRVGSSMTTEAWDEYYKPNLTWNHAWGSAPANIIPRKVMGIEPMEPAFRKIRIKPQPANLQYARLKMPTIRGAVKTLWKTERDRVTFDITIPANSTAQVWLPVNSMDGLQESGVNINKVKEIKIVGQKGNYVICEIPSGSYRFSWPK